MGLEVKVFTASMASGATLSAEVDIGKAYSQVQLEIASATTFQVNIQGARESGGNYKRLYNVVADNDNVVTPIEINSATAGPGGAIVALPQHTRFMKVESQTAVAAGTTYYFHCRD